MRRTKELQDEGRLPAGFPCRPTGGHCMPVKRFRKGTPLVNHLYYYYYYAGRQLKLDAMLSHY